MAPGQTYQIFLGWEELASYLTSARAPLDHTRYWDSQDEGNEHYRVILELVSSNHAAFSNSIVTSQGTGIRQAPAAARTLRVVLGDSERGVAVGGRLVNRHYARPVLDALPEPHAPPALCNRLWREPSQIAC